MTGKGSPLAFWMMLPATVAILLFFVLPVGLTVVFSFTTMGSDTGILGTRYVVSRETLRRLGAADFDPATLARLGQRIYVLDDDGIAALRRAGLAAPLIEEIATELGGRRYDNERALFLDLGRLRNPPRSFRVRKMISRAVARTVLDREFRSPGTFREALTRIGIVLDDTRFARLLEAADTSWRWTLGNYREMAASGFTGKILFNTALYLALTLILNVGFALVLALATFYLPGRPARLFRALWLLPRLTPSVIYVMLWKWLTYDDGFLSTVLAPFGIAERNWLLEYPWTFIVLINGFVGASMGMIIFSSAIHGIPREVLYAAEVDGASAWQQVRRIILPQLAWPILFITSYQTLSLLTSFEYIQLATDGGPGFFTTETWALYIFHTALANYFGSLRYGYGAALAVVLVALGIALALAYLRFFDFRKLVARPMIEA